MAESKTLNDVVQELAQTTTTDTFNAFLVSLNIQLIHRLPNVTDLSMIDYAEVRNIIDFSRAVTLVALDVWRETDRSQGVNRRQGMIARQQTRAA